MELLSINWNNTFIVVVLGMGLVILILVVLILLLMLWHRVTTIMHNGRVKRQSSKEERIKILGRPKPRSKQKLKGKIVSLKHKISPDKVAAISTALFLHKFTKPTGKTNRLDDKKLAAIAVALSLSTESVHDDESLVLTFRQQKTNSDWVNISVLNKLI